MFTISTKPRTVVRWSHGRKIESKHVIPIPFGQERATEIMAKAMKAAQYGPWTDQMDKFMTDSEIAYVHAVWDCMDGRSAFIHAFTVIQQGTVENYFRQYNKL